MSGVYLLFRFILILVNYHMVSQIGWLLRALMFLSLSMFILIVQPYKKSYMNVLDGLLLALMGFLTLLLITFKFLLPSDRSEMLPLIFVITCSLPQLVLLLSVTYRQLKEKWIVQFFAGRVGALLKYIQRGKQAEDELLDAEEDPLPHRLASPDQSTDLSCQCLSKLTPTLQCKDQYHPCTLMAQSTRGMDYANGYIANDSVLATRVLSDVISLVCVTHLQI